MGTGAITGTHISNATVTDVDIADEPGVEFVNEVSNQTLTATSATFSTLTLTAPTSGYIIATASGNRNCSDGSSFVVQLDNGVINSLNRSLDANVGIWTGYYVNYVFTAAAGVNSIALKANCSGGTNGSIYITSFNAIFVPTRY